MSFLYDSCAHSQGEKFYFLCTFLRGEIHWGNACTKGGKTFHIRKPCFVCFTLCVFLFSFIVLWVTFSIYALLLSLHHVYALDMHTSLCYCALLIACSDDHLLCYMIIVVISIWLLRVWSSCLYVAYMFTWSHFYLWHLYLSFYYLLYLEGLMCFVQVFQVTSIYIPSLSQFLDLVVSEFCHCSWMFKKCV